MKKLLVSISALSTILLIGSCQKSDAETTNELASPEERMVHLEINKAVSLKRDELESQTDIRLMRSIGAGETSPLKINGLGVQDKLAIPGLPSTQPKRADLELVSALALPGLFQAKNLNTDIIDSLVLRKSYLDRSNNEIVTYDQYIGGLKVESSDVKIVISPIGEIKQFFANVSDVTQSPNPANIAENTALEKAVLANAGSSAVTYLQNGVSTDFRSPPVIEKILLKRNGALEEAYRIDLWVKKDGLYWETIVDGQGNIISNELLTSQSSLTMFVENPNATPESSIAPPSHWFSGDQFEKKLHGNNVRVFADRSAADAEPADVGKKITDGIYNASFETNKNPADGTNPRVSIQNLFYLNNLIHDELYNAGFTEEAGNFQNNNYGLGGKEGDAVVVHAIDGSAFNNARFTTSHRDGFSGTMEMFVWTKTTPWRDSGLDGDIVWHEYGHGLVHRMLNKMLNDPQRAIGEAIGDTLAMVYYDDPVVGEYAEGNSSRGIRSASYAANAKTFKDYDYKTNNHANGEIYAVTMWDLWEVYKENSLTSRDFFTDLIGGMGFAPPAADYLDMRDGLLGFVDSSRTCWVWRAFGNREMGDGASMDLAGVNIVSSSEIPTACQL